MPRKKPPPHARISVTVPPAVLAAADRLAGELGRSRSWVVAEGLRRLGHDRQERPSVAMVREAAPITYTAGPDSGLGEYRLQQLEADLDLTPEARVRAAERTARVFQLAHRRSSRQMLVFFDRYEDYLDWKEREDVGL